ncbi:MAG: DUF4259 domain-containing protein [Polyangia bacterium]
MGAWGLLAFDNDDACDWAFGLEEATDLSLVESTLDEVADAGDEYLDSVAAANALAACEVVVRCLGNPGYQNAYTKNVDEWVARRKLTPSAALLKRAEAAIERILGDRSELRQLFDEADQGPAWRASVEDLRRRLRASP